jgi:hypothetical protein
MTAKNLLHCYLKGYFRMCFRAIECGKLAGKSVEWTKSLNKLSDSILKGYLEKLESFSCKDRLSFLTYVTGCCSNATERVKFQLFHALARTQLAHSSVSYLNSRELRGCKVLLDGARSNLSSCKMSLDCMKNKVEYCEDDFVNTTLLNDLEKEIKKRRLMVNAHLLKIDADSKMHKFINLNNPGHLNRVKVNQI